MMMRAALTPALVKAKTAARSRAVLRPVVAYRRVIMWANAPGKNEEKDGEHHGLISVWEDKQLTEDEQPPKAAQGSDQKHTLVSVWEEQELKQAEQADKSKKEQSLLNKPTGQQGLGSSYDSM